MQGLGPVLPLACPPLTHIHTGDETALPRPPDMPHVGRQGLGVGSEGIMPLTLCTVKSPSSTLPPSCPSPPPRQPAHSAGLLPPRLLGRASSLFPFTRWWSLACCAPWGYAVRLGQSQLRGGSCLGGRCGTALGGGHSALFCGWCGSPIGGWSSTPVSGWGDAPIGGWGDAPVGGWGDASVGGWSGTAICGWGGTTVCRGCIITLYSKSSITCCG